jgi:hypothetical protein
VAILIKNSIPHNQTNSRNTKYIENIFIEILGKAKTFKIGSIYAPPSTTVAQLKDDLNILMTSHDTCIIAGDFNSKHHAWNNSVKNKKGIVLNEIILKNNYHLAAPDDPTLFPPRGNPSIMHFFIYKNVQVSGTKTMNDLR